MYALAQDASWLLSHYPDALQSDIESFSERVSIKMESGTSLSLSRDEALEAFDV